MRTPAATAIASTAEKASDRSTGAGPTRALSVDVAGEKDRRQARLRWERCLKGGERRVIRTRTERRDDIGAVGHPGFRCEDEPGLEEREIGEAARDVAVRDLQQAGYERAAQERCLAVERVGQSDGRHRLPDADPCRSFAAAVVNGNDGVSTKPAAASAFATRRRPSAAL
jgi:hypothetical protein